MKEYLNCFVCEKKILLLPRQYPVDIHWWGDRQPDTHYWNVERKEVYCSPTCSHIAEGKWQPDRPAMPDRSRTCL